MRDKAFAASRISVGLKFDNLQFGSRVRIKVPLIKEAIRAQLDPRQWGKKENTPRLCSLLPKWKKKLSVAEELTLTLLSD